MEWLNEYHLSGLLIGICTFLIIGLFHPVVVKAEYYWGNKMLVDFPDIRYRGSSCFIEHRQYTRFVFIGRIRFLFFLDHQRSL